MELTSHNCQRQTPVSSCLAQSRMGSIAPNGLVISLANKKILELEKQIEKLNWKNEELEKTNMNLMMQIYANRKEEPILEITKEYAFRKEVKEVSSWR